MSRRHEWFREGARSLRATQRLLGKEHLLPSDEDWYACPPCLKYLFLVGALDEEEKRLTEEHAPPEALGGRELALTCWWSAAESVAAQRVALISPSGHLFGCAHLQRSARWSAVCSGCTSANKWWFLARSGRRAGATSLATHGDLSRCVRHRSHEAYGIGDEPRGSFVIDGSYWGRLDFSATGTSRSSPTRKCSSWRSRGVR